MHGVTWGWGDVLDIPLISIVDDDAWARDGIRELIQALGYRASTFASAQNFLDSGLVEETACLITDLQMPGLSGLDLQQRLLSDGRHTPIIFITAYPDDARRDRALDAGAVGFLSKPLEEPALVSCLHRAVGR